MSGENVVLARAALNWFAQLDEGLVGPERVAQFFGQDPITTFSRFGAFVTLHQRGKPHGSDSWVEMDYGMVYTVEGD
jgi:hypothetical protein